MIKKFNQKLLKLSVGSMAAVMLLCSCSGNNGDNNDGNESDQNNVGGASVPVSDSNWNYSQFAMGGGGFVSGVFSTSEEGLYYARTDVGGAYRWDKTDGRWKSISYNITEEDVGLLGIDGFAADPDEPNKIYLLAGTSYFSNGKTCIMISHDYGETYETVDVTDKIKAHGNGMGRQNGERIAIDPVNNDIIYVGGRTGGLIKSTDAVSYTHLTLPTTSRV